MAYLGNGPGVASQRVSDTFSVSTTTSTFTPSAGYTVGYLDVYHNGVKLVNGDDYTASNGSTFVLTTAAQNGDTVECVAYIPRGLSDGYTKAEADSRYMSINAVTLPTQTGNSGKFLTTDGTTASWSTVTVPELIVDPVNTSPANGSTNLGNGGFSLVSSAFKSMYGETHAYSQWQISTSSSFSTTVVSTGDSASLTSYTVGAVLSANTTYYWRVRYKDSNGTYSDWSAATTFVTMTAFTYTVEYLVIAGGGGGGSSNGGGGGAGGYIDSTSAALTPTTAHTITVGGGGAGAVGMNNTGANGSNSSAFSSTSVGGGYGASEGSSNSVGSGGSGGGANGYNNGPYGSGTSGQGYAGGSGNRGANYAGGGGGGATSVGGNGGTYAGNGGTGINWKSLGTYYAGGGGGGAISATYFGSGGSGVGGAGGTVGGSATANRGGGGGGSINDGSGVGGAGGSGVVIIRYAGSQRGTGGTVTSAGGYTYHTFTSSGTYTA